MKTKQKTDWFVITWIFSLILVIIIFLIGVISTSESFVKRNYSHPTYAELDKPQVINGNLYIGYQDGVRIGYHQDGNGVWWKCVRGCVPLPDRRGE